VRWGLPSHYPSNTVPAVIASLFATLLVVVGMLVAARLIRTPVPAKPSVVRGEPYECGEIPTGGSWRVMPVGFAAFAILFILFDVELAFLTPWLRADMASRAVVRIPMLAFLITLFLGWVHAWRKADLRWKR